MPRVRVNDINIYYELHGPEDGEVLVLSNGIMMSTASWYKQTPVLSSHLRLLLYDCRGMWQSDHPAGPYSMEQHADDLAGLLDALGIARAHIGGISYGSEVSLMFALRHPERVQSLIVIDGVPEVTPLLQAQTLPWRMAAERGDAELLLRTSVPFNYSEAYIAANQAGIDSSVPLFARIDMRSFVAMMDAFTTYHITEQLSQIQCPTLIVAGEQDLIKGPRFAEMMAERIPACEYVLVPGAGHALCLDKPDPLNTLLLGFVLKHSGAAG